MQAAVPDDPYQVMLRGSAGPALAVGTAAVVVAGVATGAAGAWGSLLAVAVVVGFFAASLLVMGATARRRPEPQMVLAMALLTYVTKVGVLGVFLLLMQDATWVDSLAFSATALVVAVVWLAAELRAYSRLRLLVADPDLDSGDASPRRQP